MQLEIDRPLKEESRNKLQHWQLQNKLRNKINQNKIITRDMQIYNLT